HRLQLRLQPRPAVSRPMAGSRLEALLHQGTSEQPTSSPRRRGSILTLRKTLDPRFRGDDGPATPLELCVDRGMEPAPAKAVGQTLGSPPAKPGGSLLANDNRCFAGRPQGPPELPRGSPAAASSPWRACSCDGPCKGASSSCRSASGAPPPACSGVCAASSASNSESGLSAGQVASGKSYFLRSSRPQA